MPRWIAVDDWDTNKDGKISFGEAVKGTAGVFFTVLGGCLFGAVCVMAMRHQSIEEIVEYLLGWWFWFGFFLSVIVTVAVSFWRLSKPERMELNEHKEKKRRWVRENFEHDLQMGLATQVPTGSRTQTDVDTAVRVMLTYYYKHGTFSRDAVTGATNVSVRAWNEANELLKKCRLRRGREMKIDAEDFADAWGKYIDWRNSRSQWRVEDGELFVK